MGGRAEGGRGERQQREWPGGGDGTTQIQIERKKKINKESKKGKKNPLILFIDRLTSGYT